MVVTFAERVGVLGRKGHHEAAVRVRQIDAQVRLHRRPGIQRVGMAQDRKAQAVIRQLPEAVSEAAGEEGWYPGPDVPSASADLRDALSEAWQAAGHPGAAPALETGDDWALREGYTRAGARGGRQHGP